MDTTDVLLLYFGACCLGAALIAMMCERAPVMDWQEPEPKPRIRPLAGGVIQRRPDADHKTYVIPCTGRKCELDPEDGTVARIIDPVYRPMWVTQGDTDAAIIDCITKLWRPEEVA